MGGALLGEQGLELSAHRDDAIRHLLDVHQPQINGKLKTFLLRKADQMIILGFWSFTKNYRIRKKKCKIIAFSSSKLSIHLYHLSDQRYTKKQDQDNFD